MSQPEPSEIEESRREIARLTGALDALRVRFAEVDAADDYRRAELEGARAEAADARAQLREAQVRVDEYRRQVTELQQRCEQADEQRLRAEQERAAVIAALGRRARKVLAD